MSEYRPADIILFAFFAFYAAVIYTLGLLITGAFVDRYALPAIIGISLTVGWLLSRFRYPQIASLLYIIGLALVFSRYMHMVEPKENIVHVKRLAELAAKLPNRNVDLVLLDAHDFLQQSYYADPFTRKRILYVVDEDESKISSTRRIENAALYELSHYIGLRIRGGSSLVSRSEQYAVFVRDSQKAKQVYRRLMNQANVTMEASDATGGYSLLLIDPAR